MKALLFFILTLGFSLIVSPMNAMGQTCSVDNFNGYIGGHGTLLYLSSRFDSSVSYTVQAPAPEVQSAIQRLFDGDYVTGTGCMDNTNSTVRIDSIDYVGLRRLLGPWKSADGLLVFKDFTTLKFFPQINVTQVSETRNQQQEFRYSLSPSDGDAWILFLSDSKSTAFATVEFTSDNILLKIFESESGKILRTLTLERP